MFYSPQILARKGELSKLWIAAHNNVKLTKSEIFAVDVPESVRAISEPKIKLSLRVSGQLLSGVTRIHHRKVGYLFADCNEALVKIKMAFRPGVVNLEGPSSDDRAALVNLSGMAGASVINATTSRATQAAFAPTDDQQDGNRFKNVEPQMDEDFSWSAPSGATFGAGRVVTPIARRRRMDDDDLRSVHTMSESDDQWSAFNPEGEMSSVEMGRGEIRASTSRIEHASSSSGPSFIHAQEGMPEYEEPQEFDAMMGGEFAPQQLSHLMAKSWMEDGEEEVVPPMAMAPTTPVAATTPPKVKRVVKRAPLKKAVPIDLTSEEIQAGIQDVSALVTNRLDRPSLKARLAGESRVRLFQTNVSSASLGVTTIRGLNPVLTNTLFLDRHAQRVPTGKLGAPRSDEPEDIEVGRRRATLGGQTTLSSAGFPEDHGAGYVPEEFEPSAPVYDEETPLASGASQTERPLPETPSQLAVTSPSARSAREEEASQRQSNVASEKRKWHPRTVKMMGLLREKFAEKPADDVRVTYQELAETHKRRVVAGAFFEILQLKSWGRIHLEQPSPFGQINITPTDKTDAELPA